MISTTLKSRVHIVSGLVLAFFLATHFANHALGVVSMPMSLLFDPDSFYLGVLPVVVETTKMLGVAPTAVAHGALLGQMTVGFPVSPLTPATFLLVGLSGVELGAHQRFTIPLLWATSLCMVLAAVVLGVLAP